MLAFDPDAIPQSWLRVVQVASTLGALFFGGLTVYGYVLASRTLALRATDIGAMLLFIKFLILFVVTGVCGALTLVLGFVSVRCWGR
jgi:hypothetical protein